MRRMSDPFNPTHYKEGDIECIDAIKSSMEPTNFHAYLKGSIIKYLWRYDKKNDPDICLGKAQWFMMDSNVKNRGFVKTSSACYEWVGERLNKQSDW